MGGWLHELGWSRSENRTELDRRSQREPVGTGFSTYTKQIDSLCRAGKVLHEKNARAAENTPTHRIYMTQYGRLLMATAQDLRGISVRYELASRHTRYFLHDFNKLSIELQNVIGQSDRYCVSRKKTQRNS